LIYAIGAQAGIAPRLDGKPYVSYSCSMNRKTTPASRGAEQARQQLPSILAEAALGRTTLITRHGRAIAAVVPVGTVRSGKPASLLALAGSGRGLWGKHSCRAISVLRDEWNR